MVVALDRASEINMVKPGIYCRQAVASRLIAEGHMQPPEPLRAMLAAQAMAKAQ